LAITRLKGKLELWDDDKGYGFITPEKSTENIFVHIFAFGKNITRRPKIGDIIHYTVHTDNKGKTKAVDAIIEGVPLRKKTATSRPKKYFKKRESKSSWRIFNIFVFCLLLVALIIWLGQSQRKRLFKETRTSLYTLVSITAVTQSEDQARTAISEAYGELERLGRLLNFYADDSELTAINRNAGIKPVRVSPDTLEIIQAAIYAGEQTEGGFDVTVGPIVKLWDFNEETLPDAASIAEQLPFVGYRNIVVDAAASTVFLRKAGVQMDLGGIIKGFAADKAIAVLKKNGIEGGIVAVAGDIRVFGRQPDGRPWRVGVQNPRQKSEDDVLLASLNLEDKGISTSGDYQRYFIRDGVRYHHLLNPKTGFPENLCQSVTIIAPAATLTDPFATGIFVMGPKKGLAVLDRLGIGGIIVDQNGTVLMTKGLESQVQLIQPD